LVQLELEAILKANKSRGSICGSQPAANWF
jgi:hypothetical protein